MSIEQFIEQIAQGEYGPFQEYLRTGENGGPLKHLNLSYEIRCIYDKYDFLKNLFKAIKPITTLTKLDLKNNHISSKGAIAIAETLKSNITLSKLDLGNNNIGNEGANTIAEALNTNTRLAELHLADNQIDDEGAIDIAEALKTNTALTELHLSLNNIGSDGARAIAEALETNTTLTRLYLDLNHIGKLGAIAIAEALETNATLAKLNLWGNDIRNAGAIAIAEALKSNKKLAELDLSENNLNTEGEAAFLRRIPLTSGITELCMDHVNIDDINCILRTLPEERAALDIISSTQPQPITEAIAQYFTRIDDVNTQNMLIDPVNDFSRGYIYVTQHRLKKNNQDIIEQNKSREQAQAEESAKQTTSSDALELDNNPSRSQDDAQADNPNKRNLNRSYGSTCMIL